MTIIAYCDGSCPVPHKHGGWAYAITLSESAAILDSGGVDIATNNTMELRAALECMKALVRHQFNRDQCVIWTDSMYVINGMQNHRHVWSTSDWRAHDGGRIKNLDLWKEMHELANEEFRSLRFNHVKGHAGHYWNERVDGLAGSAMRAARRR